MKISTVRMRTGGSGGRCTSVLVLVVLVLLLVLFIGTSPVAAVVVAADETNNRVLLRSEEERSASSSMMGRGDQGAAAVVRQHQHKMMMMREQQRRRLHRRWLQGGAGGGTSSENTTTTILPQQKELERLFYQVLDPNCTEPKTTVSSETNTKNPPTSPESGSRWRIADDNEQLHKQFVELPADTISVESIAYNRQFDSTTAFVVVQRPWLPPPTTPNDNNGTTTTTTKNHNSKKMIQSFVYGVRMVTSSGNRDPAASAQLVLGPLTDRIGSDYDLSIWGTALTDQGHLIAAVYNQNAIMVFDLSRVHHYNDSNNTTRNNNNAAAAVEEYRDIAAPNDLAVDASGTIIFVAGGTYESITNPIATVVANPARGQVWKIDRTIMGNNDGGRRELLRADLNTLVGIEMVDHDNSLWISTLFALYRYDLSNNDSGTTSSLTKEWVGDDAAADASGGSSPVVWYADNVDQYRDGSLILTPIYGAPRSKLETSFLVEQICIASAALLAANIYSASLDNETTTSLLLAEALLDAEVSPTLYQTFVDPESKDDPDPIIRLVMVEPDGSSSYHFELSLTKTLAAHPPYDVLDPFSPSGAPVVLGQRHYFTAEITHAASLVPSLDGPGYIMLVNVEVPRILLLDDTIFTNFIVHTNPSSRLARNNFLRRFVRSAICIVRHWLMAVEQSIRNLV